MGNNLGFSYAGSLYSSDKKAKGPINASYMWQPIVNRDYVLFGSEIFTTAHTYLKESACSELPVDFSKSQLQIVNSNLLKKIQFMAVLSSGKTPACSRRIVSIEKVSLLSGGLIDELIQASNTLKVYNQQLVVVIIHRFQHEDSHLTQKNIARHLYLLKDHDIEIALDNYEKGTSHQEPVIWMNLCDYIKIDLKKAKAISSTGRATGSLNEVYDDMTTLIYERGVSFIAENVDERKQYDIARSMPFSLFQGSYFSSPEEI